MPQLALDYAAARFNMVESQIRPNQVTDQRILDTMGIMPRELFVPAGMEGIAYVDEDLPVSAQRCLMEPMVLARLLQTAAITNTDRVLDVACATGYSAAIAAALAKDVVALDSDNDLIVRAEKTLAAMHIDNVTFLRGPLNAGARDKAPFDIIIVNGGMEVEPEALLAQLNEGGRLLGVMRHYGTAHAAHIGEARLWEKIRGHVSSRPLFDANVRPLPGFETKPVFVF